MKITYRGATPLTWEEMDANFMALSGEMDKLEGAVADLSVSEDRRRELMDEIASIREEYDHILASVSDSLRDLQQDFTVLAVYGDEGTKSPFPLMSDGKGPYAPVFTHGGYLYSLAVGRTYRRRMGSYEEGYSLYLVSLGRFFP